MSCSSSIKVLALVLMAPGVARADKAAAEAAFQEGKRLIAAGKVSEACPKFELSHQQDPQLGSLLNVADCHERDGKLATAWAEFREAVELARQRGDDRESFAQSRVDKLAPRIARIELVRREGAEGLQVSLDGRDVTALVGVPTPIDPGEHTVTTRGDGQPEASKTVRVTREGHTLRIEVPIESATGDEVGDETPAASGRGRKRIALVTAGLGVVTTGVGLYFGKRASDQYDDRLAYCTADNRCSPQGAALIDDARSSALVSTVLVGVGVGAIVTGAVLWLTAPSETSRQISARATITTQHVGAALHVQF